MIIDSLHQLKITLLLLTPARVKISETEYLEQRRVKVLLSDVLALRLLVIKHGASLFSDLSKHE
jgi:hypothetical protein